MKDIPHYTKILTLGSAYTENALIGNLILQEKVDGSQFRFGINEDKELLFASKGCKLIPIEQDDELINIQKMFRPAIKYLLSIKDRFEMFTPDTYFYGEILEKPKHNVLKYERIPKNHIVLFDCIYCGKYAYRELLMSIANRLEIDIIPELYTGECNIDKIKELLNTPSYLGNELIEGVVIKNYNQTIMLGGQVFPLFTKYVRETFKERHNIEWKVNNPKNSLIEYIKGFCSEARWQKAILHLKEKGLLIQSPKDIGILIKEIQNDILEEETQNIKDYLFDKFKEDILRNSIKGFPEWYKNKLLENLHDKENIS